MSWVVRRTTWEQIRLEWGLKMSQIFPPYICHVSSGSRVITVSSTTSSHPVLATRQDQWRHTSSYILGLAVEDVGTASAWLVEENIRHLLPFVPSKLWLPYECWLRVRIEGYFFISKFHTKWRLVSLLERRSNFLCSVGRSKKKKMKISL